MRYVISIFCLYCCTYVSGNEFLSHFENFKVSYNKSYNGLYEEAYRFNIFSENLKHIKEHNEKYSGSGIELYELGINKFADMSPDEFSRLSGSAKLFSVYHSSVKHQAKVNASHPASVDWRSKGVVGPVRDQGLCGACWAFASLSSLESLYALKYGQLLQLSTQNLIDCTGTFGNHGCHGGDVLNSYQYVRYQGIMTEKAYPNTGKSDTCKFSPDESVLKIDGSKWIEKTEAALQEAVANVGPVAAYVDASEWHLYTRGIFEAKKPFRELTHVVTVVGYGSENGTDYWLLKNSYGRDYGENGYIRIARNKNNMFGIAKKALYPVV